MELTNTGSLAHQLALGSPSPHSEAGIIAGPPHTHDIYVVSGTQTPVLKPHGRCFKHQALSPARGFIFQRLLNIYLNTEF